MSTNEVNYEALGRYVHLKQQRDTLYLRMQSMKDTVGTLQFALENPRSGSNERLQKSIEAVGAIIPELAKLNREVTEMTEEMSSLATRYNLGGLVNV